MRNVVQPDRTQNDVLTPLAETRCRVAANLVMVKTGSIPTLFEIERKGGALAQALGSLLLFAEPQGSTRSTTRATPSMS